MLQVKEKTLTGSKCTDPECEKEKVVEIISFAPESSVEGVLQKGDYLHRLDNKRLECTKDLNDACTGDGGDDEEGGDIVLIYSRPPSIERYRLEFERALEEFTLGLHVSCSLCARAVVSAMRCILCVCVDVCFCA